MALHSERYNLYYFVDSDNTNWAFRWSDCCAKVEVIDLQASHVEDIVVETLLIEEPFYTISDVETLIKKYLDSL